MSIRSQSATRSTRQVDRDYHLAWLAVALIPVSAVVAMFVGEGLISMLGYPGGGDQPPPIGAALVAGVPALLVLVGTAVTAFYVGRRAYRAGKEAAIGPMVIGGGFAVVAIALNLLGVLVGR